MILQALTSLYEALAQKGEVPKEGWSPERISFALGIDENGDLLRITPLFKPGDMPKGKKKEEPQEMTVPAAVKRTSGAAANFLWDNSSYILGVSLKKGENDAKREKRRNKDIKCFEACRELHHSMLDGMEYPAAKAVLNFLDKWEPQKAEENNLVAQYAKEILSGAKNMVFRFNGGYVHDDPQLASVWQKANAKQKDNIGQCLVTGALDEIQKTHPTIEDVQGANPAGAALVSFNESAFCSYKKKQNQNAPVGKYAAFAYTTALNHLLADKSNVHRIGDASVVCWAENADKQYEDFAAEVFFGDNVDKSDEQRLSALRTSLKLLADGLPCKEMDLDPDRKFYILGLSPNNGRIAVRFFYCDSFGKIAGNIYKHHERLEIVRPSYDKFPILPLWKLLSATNRTIKKKNDNGTNAERSDSEDSDKSKDKTQNSAMAGAVARAVFSGGRYPASLLECTFLRIKAERSITRERAAIIKAYYLRNPNEKCPKEVLTVSLNENSKNIPYTLGRLFSVYEEIQKEANLRNPGNPGINTTIKDRYFGSAAAMPATVFPILSNLAQKHLRKLSDKQRIYLDKKVMTLKSVLGEQYPAHMSLPEQGSFDLGYYHQTQARYTKKEDK